MFLTKFNSVYGTELRLFDDVKYPQYMYTIPSSLRKVGRGRSYPAHRLVESLVTDDIRDYLTDNPVAGKTALLFAGGSQSWTYNYPGYTTDRSSTLQYNDKAPFVGMTNVFAGKLANKLGVVDHVSTDASACASSLKVLMDAQSLMSMYGYDRVIVASTEESITEDTLGFFGESEASLPISDMKHQKPSAFDAVNGRFHLGQSACLAVFEKEHPNMVDPISRMVGAYTASEDNSNILAQREDGQGFVNAIQGALSAAKLQPKDITLVKTHGTGTPVNNIAERNGLTRCLDDFIATAYKPVIGHTLGPSGLVETGLLLDDIHRGVIPAIPNRTERDEIFISEDRAVPEGYFVSLAAGMGNIYASAIFSIGV